MLTIVGGGPGIPGMLTEAAIGAMERAEEILAEASIREVLGTRRDWLVKTVGASPESVEACLAGMEQHEWVWLVPGTPSLYAPVRAFMESLRVEQWQHIRIVSGVSVGSSELDRQGLFLPEHQNRVVDEKGEELLHWDGRSWTGPWRDQEVPWFSTRPLYGRRVVLLRDGGRAQRALRWLEDWGAAVEIWPVSRLTDPASYDAVDAAIRRLERYDWIIFTSGEAVQRWFDRMKRLGKDVREMRAKIAVVGPETAIQVRERGLIPELMPEAEYSQEGLAEAFGAVPVRGSVVLFPGGQLNRTFLGDTLRGRGALMDEVVLYQNQPQPLSLTLHHTIRTESYDAILYTASSQVEYLVDQLSPEDRRHLANIPSFSIGPLTTRTLSHYGISIAREAPEPSLRLLVDSVREYYAKENPHVSD